MRNQYYIIIGAFCVAGLLWFTVTMSESYEWTFVVPMSVEELPHNKALRAPLPPTIRVLLRGSGWELLFLRFGKNIHYRIDPSQIKNDRLLLTNKNLAIAMRLPSGIVALEAYPETLSLSYDSFHSKRVKVIPDIILECVEGFGKVGPIELIPDSITISGAEVILRNISEWKTKTARFVNISEHVSVQVELSDSLSTIVKKEVESVALLIPVEQLADVKFSSIPISVLGAPANAQILFAPASIDIIVRGGVRKLSSLSAESFSAQIDFSLIEQDTTNAAMPQIQLPEGVILLQTIPEFVRFTIRQ